MSLMFNPTKTKVQLKLAINRLKLLQQKKTAFNQSARKDIAQLLDTGKDDSARVRVEHIIREDFAIEAMEILELYCEMLLARFGLLEMMRTCDAGIEEAVNTIIFAAARVDVKELSLIRDQLVLKFGKDFGMNALENGNDCVNSRIVHKLGIQAPDAILVDQYLKAIANAYNVKWDGMVLPSEELLHAVPNAPAAVSQTNFALPTGAAVEQAKGLEEHQIDPALAALLTPMPPISSLQPIQPSIGPTPNVGGDSSVANNLDDLSKRKV
ncbi:regulator of Vps4 activity in the MVB pathway-domain-containing protein [Chytriomyces sp. MP71]|nr:regulator of Vps4 activity in the MVB pathway-domain-containing protein [Chytriomyces sp. MP71]